LCGFANLASIGINIAGLGGICPSRFKDIARMAFKAFIAATIATYISATICGMMF
jgi:CNT family concentrative nucleoside transporter